MKRDVIDLEWRNDDIGRTQQRAQGECGKEKKIQTKRTC